MRKKTPWRGRVGESQSNEGIGKTTASNLHHDAIVVFKHTKREKRET